MYAISIWSHFGENAAKRWLTEMGRIVKPGGALMLTTHGTSAIADHVRRNEMLPRVAAEGLMTLLSEGFWFQETFGPEGDWGVKHPEWGMSYMDAGWVPRQLGDTWLLALYEPGRMLQNQDVWVLVRR